MFLFIKGINIQERFRTDSKLTEIQVLTNSKIGALLYCIYDSDKISIGGIVGQHRNATVGFVLLGAKSTNLHLSIVYGQTFMILYHFGQFGSNA